MFQLCDWKGIFHIICHSESSEFFKLVISCIITSLQETGEHIEKSPVCTANKNY